MSSLTPEAYAVIEGRHSDPLRYLGSVGLSCARAALRETANPRHSASAVCSWRAHRDLCRKLILATNPNSDCARYFISPRPHPIAAT
jgi:hypothetical protein